jgi:hypothetical protein
MTFCDVVSPDVFIGVNVSNVAVMALILHIPSRENMGVSQKLVSWTSKFVTMVLHENGRRSNVTILVITDFFDTPTLP